MTYEDKTNQDFIDLEREVGDVLRGLDKVTAYGLLRGFLAAIKVAEAHSEDRGLQWLELDDDQHSEHAEKHLSDSYDSDIDGSDNLPHLDHAACRLLFAIARRDG